MSGAGLNMPKSSNQKLKLLYLLRILQKETDEEHYLNSQQLIERLEKYDISAERKSIYDDIARLTDFGYDIIPVSYTHLDVYKRQI